MAPKPINPNSFFMVIEDLIKEINSITTNKNLVDDHVLLCNAKNLFREKCLQFLRISFSENENKYFNKFEKEFHEISQVETYLTDKVSNSIMKNIYLDQFKHATFLLSSFKEATKFIQSINDDLPTEITDQGLYFKGQYFDAIFKLNSIIISAKKEIKLVDNFISIDLINFLSNSINKINLKILTSNYNINSIKLLLNSYHKQVAKIEIRETNLYHDRFLILDEKDVFHFGASLKDLGNKTFMFSRITDTSIQTLINKDFDSNWTNSNVLFP